MALFPALFTDFDDAFDDPFFANQNWTTQAANAMSTDVKENNGNYELSIELPGFDKKDVHVQLRGGNLVVSAVRDADQEQKDKQGRVIRRERVQGSRTRSFYVGDNLKPGDVSASFKNGVLTLTFPKELEAPKQEDQTVQIGD